MTGSKQDALIEVVDIIKRHGLTLEEIYAALQGSPEFKAQKSGGILMRVFGYLGGLFVFAGVSAFVGMQWKAMGFVGHVICTLGFGFLVFIMALTCARNDKFAPAATPLFLLAAVMQPAGIALVLKEFSHGGNPAYGIIFIMLLMTIQQGCAFKALNRTALAFTTLVFGGCLAFAIFDQMRIPDELIGLVMGISLTCIGYALDKSQHRALAWIGYLIGSLLVMGVVGSTVAGSWGEILFLGVSVGYIVLSTYVRSKTLLVMGMLGTLSYISYYMVKYFGDSPYWPIALVLAGVLLIGAGVLTVKINAKYIKQQKV